MTMRTFNKISAFESLMMLITNEQPLIAYIAVYDLTLTKGTQTSWGCQGHWTEFKKW